MPRVCQLAADQSIDEVLAEYPYLEREDILAALEFAAAIVDSAKWRSLASREAADRRQPFAGGAGRANRLALPNPMKGSLSPSPFPCPPTSSNRMSEPAARSLPLLPNVSSEAESRTALVLDGDRAWVS